MLRPRTTLVQCLRVFFRNNSSLTTSASLTQPYGKKNIPSPRGLPLIGTTLSFLAAGSATKIHEYIDARHRQLGPIFQENIGPLNAVFISDADDIRRVFALEGKYPKNFKPEAWVLYNEIHGCERGLFFMNDEDWLACRRSLNEMFLKADSGRQFEEPCDFVARDLAARWRAQRGSEVVNLEAKMYQWGIRVMMSVLLGVETYSRNENKFQYFIDEIASGMNQIMDKSSKISLLPAKLAARLHLPAWTSFVNVLDNSLKSVQSFLLHLLDEFKDSDGLLKRMLDSGMDETFIRRIVTDLIIAAGDTSAHAMEWMLYTLGRNPEVQEQLFEELKGMNTSHELMQSSLLKNCMRESMRLYPIAPFLLRSLPAHAVIRGYTIPAEQVIMLSIYSSGRDEKYFPEPTRFWPQRWSRDNSGHYTSVNSPYASLPFAMGARSCLGRKIAETEIMLATARLVKQFKIELIDSSQVDMIVRFVSVPSKPIRLWLTER